MKLLFDIYHVAIMNGDVIRRLRQYCDWIGHPAVMRTLLEIGYKGYVVQEFLPTRDPEEGLAEATELCDV